MPHGEFRAWSEQGSNIFARIVRRNACSKFKDKPRWLCKIVFVSLFSHFECEDRKEIKQCKRVLVYLADTFDEVLNAEEDTLLIQRIDHRWQNFRALFKLPFKQNLAAGVTHNTVEDIHHFSFRNGYLALLFILEMVLKESLSHSFIFCSLILLGHIIWQRMTLSYMIKVLFLLLLRYPQLPRRLFRLRRRRRSSCLSLLDHHPLFQNLYSLRSWCILPLDYTLLWVIFNYFLVKVFLIILIKSGLLLEGSHIAVLLLWRAQIIKTKFVLLEAWTESTHLTHSLSSVCSFLCNIWVVLLSYYLFW